MKLLRFLDVQGRSVCGRVQAGSDRVELLEGPSLLDPPVPSGGAVSLADITRFLPPVDPPNIIAIGQNYHEHAREMGKGIPDEPLVFLKATTSLNHHGGPIYIPRAAPDAVDYEGELVLVIGRTARDVREAGASGYLLGCTCGNDVTARDCQRHDGQWARAKSFDSFGPIGPWIDTEVDPGDLGIRSLLNGRVMQDCRTADMIFSAARIVSYVSRMFTLLPGTVIFTGTGPGIGMARSPQVFLRAGDTITVEIEGIGRLENPVIGPGEA